MSDIGPYSKKIIFRSSYSWMKTKTDNVYCTEEIEPTLWLSNDLETIVSKNYQKWVFTKGYCSGEILGINPLEDRREIIFVL